MRQQGYSPAEVKRSRVSEAVRKAKRSHQRKLHRLLSSERRFSVPELGYSALSDGQRTAAHLIEAGDNVFVTGSAGTGKGRVLHQVRLGATEAGLNVVTLASTGTASDHIGGQTIFSAVGIQIGTQTLRVYLSRSSPVRRSIFERADLILLDEVSGLNMDYLRKAERVIASTRGNMDLAWGGIQVVAFGDFAQLGCVRSEIHQGESGRTDTFLPEACEWDAWFPTTVLLHRIFRQNGDSMFADILERVRMGEASDRDIRMLNACVKEPKHPYSTQQGASHTVTTQITPFVKRATEINQAEHRKLTGPFVVFQPELKVVMYDVTSEWISPDVEVVPGQSMYKRFIRDIEDLCSGQTSTAQRRPKASVLASSCQKQQFRNSLHRADNFDMRYQHRYRDVERSRGKGGEGDAPTPQGRSSNQQAYTKWKEDQLNAVLHGPYAHIDTSNEPTTRIISAVVRGERVKPRIQLKQGDRVMVTQNINPEARLVNGSAGVVVGFVLQNHRQKARKLSETEADAVLSDYEGVRDGRDLCRSLNAFEAFEAWTGFTNVTDPECGVRTASCVARFEVLRASEFPSAIRNVYPVIRFQHGRFVIRPHVIRRSLAVSSDDYRSYSITISTLPLAHDWCTTIHKIQGHTLDSVVVDPRGVKEPGQLYVALSRVHSLNELQLVAPVRPEYIVPFPPAVRYYQQALQLCHNAESFAVSSHTLRQRLWAHLDGAFEERVRRSQAADRALPSSDGPPLSDSPTQHRRDSDM